MLVTGIGQCCWDYLAVADVYPAADSKCELLDWEEQGGGPVATALVTLARFGVVCRFAGVCGDDELGGKIRCSLIDEGIDIAGLKERKDAVSQRAFIVVEKKRGSRTIFWQRSTGAPLQPDELAEGFLDGSRLLHLDGLMQEVSLAAARKARKRGIPIMLDAGRLRPGMLELAGLCDYLVAAEQFALDLGWDGTPQGMAGLAAETGAAVMTITLGSRGSLTWCAGNLLEVPAFAVDVVDTTGAGDVFHGGYIYGLLRGWGLRETIEFASATAALKCTQLGGRKGIPRLGEVKSFLGHGHVKKAVVI